MSELTVSTEERRATVTWWCEHQDALLATAVVPQDVLFWIAHCLNPDNIGYEQGQVRPGKMGQWDVYDMLMGSVSETNRLLLSGLSAQEVAESNRRIKLEDAGVDPDNPGEVARFELMAQMSPSQLDNVIAGLERQLAQ